MGGHRDHPSRMRSRRRPPRPGSQPPRPPRWAAVARLTPQVVGRAPISICTRRPSDADRGHLRRRRARPIRRGRRIRREVGRFRRSRRGQVAVRLPVRGLRGRGSFVSQRRLLDDSVGRRRGQARRDGDRLPRHLHRGRDRLLAADAARRRRHHPGNVVRERQLRPTRSGRTGQRAVPGQRDNQVELGADQRVHRDRQG